MRLAAIGPFFPLILAACGATRETTGVAAPLAVTSAELPGAKPSPRAAQAPAAPAERDACTAYADCIDAAPAPDPNEGGMHASPATIRGWERSAEQLRQCVVAHDLARAGGLCR
jgi:hypothetical protein